LALDPEFADGLPGIPSSGRLRFSRLQLRGSAGIDTRFPVFAMGAKTRKPKDISKNENVGSRNLPGAGAGSQPAYPGLAAEPVWDANKPPKCQPILAS
jgi:hypothetical protein